MHGNLGPGNFDSDTAADHLSILTARLVEEITAAMAEPDTLEPDEYAGVAVPCNVELLALIAEQRWVGCELPAPAVITAWRDTLLGVWDATIDGLGPSPDHKRDRRAVLGRTFERLLAQSTRQHGDAATSALAPASSSTKRAAAPRKKQAATRTAGPSATRTVTRPATSPATRTAARPAKAGSKRAGTRSRR